MPLRFLRILGALLAAALAPGLALASPADHALTQVVDGYTIALALPADTPVTGPNSLTVTLRAADGTPVSGAAVTVSAAADAADDGHGASQGNAAAARADAPAADHGATDHGATHSAPAAPAADHPADEHRHEAIPTMLEAGQAPGSYHGTLHLQQAGTATITVGFTVAGQERAALFHIAVAQARPRALLLGGFALVNGVAIAAAAVLKRRVPRKQPRAATARPAAIPLAASHTPSDEERPA